MTTATLTAPTPASSGNVNPFDFLRSPTTATPTEPPQTQTVETPAVAPTVQPEATEPKGLAAAAVETTPVKTPRRRNTAATSTSNKYLFVDIETVPDESRMHLFGLDPLPTPAEYLAENDSAAPSELVGDTIEAVKEAVAKAQSSGKKLPKVILEGCIVCEKKRPKPRSGVLELFSKMIFEIDNEAAIIAGHTEAQRKTMSVTPEFCRIVAIGFGIGSDPVESMVVGAKSADGLRTLTEVDLLERFWSLATSGAKPPVIVGYNVLGFDLPTIFVRSALLGVDPTRKLDLKPWGGDACDLMQSRFPRSQAMKLKSLAQLMGISVPAEGVDGSQVFALFQAGELEKIGEYVRSDISITRELHAKYLGLFC